MQGAAKALLAHQSSSLEHTYLNNYMIACDIVQAPM